MFDIEEQAETSDFDLESKNPELFRSFVDADGDVDGHGGVGDQPGNIQELLKTIQLLKVRLKMIYVLNVVVA